MATTQINGGTQIRSGTITTTQLAASAGITDGQLASSYLYADGSRALTGNLQGGAHEATNFATPTAATSLSTKGYVDAAVQGLSEVHTARAGTNTETLTIATGSVTTITGTTVDGVTLNVGEYVYIPNAPAASGAAGGGSFTTQPANGLYQVTGNTTNISLARAPEMSGANTPFGKRVTVVSGATWGGGEYMVTTPSSNAAFTYGTNNIAFGQVNGLADVTVGAGGSLVKAGNQLTRGALTGDVTAAADNNATTISAGSVSLAKMSNLAANSLIGNTTGSAATPAAVPVGASPAASTVSMWDANQNLSANNQFSNFTSTATAAGTTTLTITSAKIQLFTGVTTQTVKLPTTGVPAGAEYQIINSSTGAVTVQSSGGNTIATLSGGQAGWFIAAVATPTTAANWNAIVPGSGGGTVTTESVVTANGFAGSVANASTTPAITLTTTVTGLLKGNGTAISAATAGTDYMAPSDFVIRETPSGTINGSNTAFTLANTPLAGTEQVYLNGLLQDAGAGNDYTISGVTITMLSAPATGDKIRASYQK